MLDCLGGMWRAEWFKVRGYEVIKIAVKLR